METENGWDIIRACDQILKPKQVRRASTTAQLPQEILRGAQGRTKSEEDFEMRVGQLIEELKRFDSELDVQCRRIREFQICENAGVVELFYSAPTCPQGRVNGELIVVKRLRKK